MTSAKRLFWGENIGCKRGTRVLFQNLSFEMGVGDILHLTGANGAGKSSLLRIMSGLLPMVEGKLIWYGRIFLENGIEAHAKRLAFLPSDDRSLKTAETVIENLQFWATVWGADDKLCQKALDAMEILKLKDTPVRHLSAGQKRRVSLARVLLKQAPLWLLDEPLNGLDRASCELFMQMANEQCKNGGMVVVASHDQLMGMKVKTLEVGA